MAPDSAKILNGPEDGVFLFGRNLSEFPCFRSSFLSGIISGVTGGMLYFLYSSKPAHSSHAALGTFSAVTLFYWTVCRYNYYKLKLEINETVQVLSEKSDIKLLNVDERMKELEQKKKGNQ